MHKFIFLDFDGVLHPAHPRTDRRSSENHHFSYLDNFLRAVDEVVPDAKIVVSSSWRNWGTYWATVPPRLLDRVHGITPHLAGGAWREDECLAWIHLNHPHEEVQWLFVDDQASYYRSQDKLFVTQDGFRDEDAAALEERCQTLFAGETVAASDLEIATSLII